MFRRAGPADQRSVQERREHTGAAVLSDYEPPRDDVLWLTGGVAYAWNNYEIGFGAGRSDTQITWLGDFRLRLR